MNSIYTSLHQFFLSHIDEIQKLAIYQHKQFLGGKLRKSYLDKYTKRHIEVIKLLASNLGEEDVQQGIKVFMQLGTELARDSVRDKLTIEEAIDGIIFLKEAIWQLLEKQNIIDKLTKQELFHISQVISTYCNLISSKIAIEYHKEYLQQAQKEVVLQKKLEQHKDDFMGIVSHELKTPVTSLKAFGQVLRKRFDKEGNTSAVEQLTKMDGQINKLTALIGDLLDATKINEGKMQFHEEYFSFDDLVKEIIEEMQWTTEKHTLIQEGRTGQTICADKDRTGQVLINLLTNAIKYSPHTSKIMIKLSKTKQSVQACVQDFGIGIAKEKHDKVFDRFFRVEGNKTETYAGLGLGLYVAAEIIKRQGGAMWVESTEGKGATFCFTLPIKETLIKQEKNDVVMEEVRHE